MLVAREITDSTSPVFSQERLHPYFVDNTQSRPLNYTAPTATDDVDGMVPVICSIPRGEVFSNGTTPVTCTATDSAGNTATTSFNVELVFWDTIPPTFDEGSVPTIVQEEILRFPLQLVLPTVTDNFGVTSVDCQLLSGSRLTFGDNPLICVAVDHFTNRAVEYHTVFVPTPPLFEQTAISCSITVPIGGSVTTSVSDCGDYDDYYFISPPRGLLPLYGSLTIDEDLLSFTYNAPDQEPPSPETFRVRLDHRYPSDPPIEVDVTFE